MNHCNVIVVGGGQAGLAMGYHLAQQGRDFAILDAADGPAAAWRGRWDSLKLFTPARHDSLPGLPFPGDPDHYPTRDEVVAYLTEYARRFDLPIEYDSRVRAIRRQDDGYLVALDDRSYLADQVVVATGPFQTPRTPALATGLDPAIAQMHSSAYRSPQQIPAGPVLVVGGGNTGYQIAEELAATHQVHLSVGSRQTPLPQRLFGRDIFSYLVAIGLMNKTRDSRLGRRLRDRETLIGSSPRAARRHGIQLHGRTTGATGRSVTFHDGTSLEIATVLWATGFDSTTPGSTRPSSTPTAPSSTNAESPAPPASTSSACPGSTPAAPPCSGGLRKTPPTSPRRSALWPRAAPGPRARSPPNRRD
jgi:putative flavoprotein involved in K+ transport